MASDAAYANATKLTVTYRALDGSTRAGWLATEHATSSPGLAVLVDVATGDAINTAACGEVSVLRLDEHHALVVGARAAGYRIRAEL